MRSSVVVAAASLAAGMLSILQARQQPPGPAQPQPDDVVVRTIVPPAHPLPAEAETARATRFSFIADGDTRSGGPSRSGEPPEDGRVSQREHGLVVDGMVKAASR